MEAALAALDSVSNDIIGQLSESGILAGIRSAEVAPAIAEWRAEPSAAPVSVPELRVGCAETLRAAVESGWDLGVLSISWCPPIIHAYLPILSDGAQSERNGMVWANAIDEATGRVNNKIDGAIAKRAVIQTLIDETTMTLAGSSALAGPTSLASTATGVLDPEPRRAVIYLGDSTTDLLALLAADIGILIGNSASTRDVASKFGIALKPLHAAQANNVEALCSATEEGSVWEAESWEEVRVCLGLPNSTADRTKLQP